MNDADGTATHSYMRILTHTYINIHTSEKVAMSGKGGPFRRMDDADGPSFGLRLLLGLRSVSVSVARWVLVVVASS